MFVVFRRCKASYQTTHNTYRPVNQVETVDEAVDALRNVREFRNVGNAIVLYSYVLEGQLIDVSIKILSDEQRYQKPNGSPNMEKICNCLGMGARWNISNRKLAYRLNWYRPASKYPRLTYSGEQTKTTSNHKRLTYD